MYDSTTHAMTEVALGLSMAFFSLMILAMLSLQTPKMLKENTSSIPVSESEKVKVSASSAQRSESSVPSEGQTSNQFGFYYQGKLWDEQLQERALNSFSHEQPLVIAVSKNESFNKVMALRQQINHPNLFITTLDEQWQSTLEQMQ